MKKPFIVSFDMRTNECVTHVRRSLRSEGHWCELWGSSPRSNHRTLGPVFNLSEHHFYHVYNCDNNACAIGIL